MYATSSNLFVILSPTIVVLILIRSLFFLFNLCFPLAFNATIIIPIVCAIGIEYDATNFTYPLSCDRIDFTRF